MGKKYLFIIKYGVLSGLHLLDIACPRTINVITSDDLCYSPIQVFVFALNLKKKNESGQTKLLTFEFPEV